jgi:RimJ/RimL family protein N-acetyltransferase
MPTLPTITTDRLVLRPFTADDAPRVQQLAGDRAVASTTLLIPHPYPDGAAEEWIATHVPAFEMGQSLNLAVTSREDGSLIGAIGLNINKDHSRAEIGYWIGRPYWSRGYATEAVAAVVAFAFDTLSLNRIFAHHFTRNPASGRVLEKVGMTFEGISREHFRKWETFEDIRHYGMLRSDYDERNPA